MTGTREEYEKAKRAYKAAGKKAKDSPANAAVRQDYEEKKAAYHKLGRNLKAGLLNVTQAEKKNKHRSKTARAIDNAAKAPIDTSK
jgi:hypothetical protein